MFCRIRLLTDSHINLETMHKLTASDVHALLARRVVQ